MDPAADEGAPDELFVRPVVRIPVPSPAEGSSTSCEISGKRQRSQVQRLRSSELAGRNSTSPSASPRGAGKLFDGGPPEKVPRRSSPGGSLLVDVENGASCSPMPSPAADSPGGGGTGKKWETTTSRYLAKHGSRSPGNSPRTPASSSTADVTAAPSSNGSAGIGEPVHGARGHLSNSSKSEEASSVRSHNPSRISEVRKPAKPPAAGGGAGGDKVVGSSRGSGSGGSSSGKPRGRPKISNGGGGGDEGGDGSGRKDKEVSFASTRRAEAPQISQAPPVVTPQQLPSFLAKLKSAAAPEVGAGVKGLWGLVCAGHLQVVAKEPTLLDSLAFVIASGTTQNRFYALAVVGELAFFNVQRSQLISSHAALRAGLVRVLREGKGIEGEGGKLIRNTSANDPASALLWASEPGLVQAMVDCAGASSHTGACIVGAMYAMARAPEAALVLGNAGIAEKVLEPCLKEAIPGDQGADVRDRSRVKLACAVMALLCIRDAQHAAATCRPAVNPGAAAVSAVSTETAETAAASASPAAAPGACRAGANGDAEAGGNAGSEEASFGKDEAVARTKDTTEVVLDRRALVQLQRVLQASVDSVTYGGVKFSLEAALHSLPAAVASAAHVAILCELGIVELLVAVVKQCATMMSTAAGADTPGAGCAEAAASNSQGADVGETHLRVLAISVRVLRRMCSPEVGASTQGLCVQRLSIVGALAVMSTMVQELETLSAQPSSGTAGVVSSPSEASQQLASEGSFLLPRAATISKSSVLDDAKAVLKTLKTAVPLASP